MDKNRRRQSELTPIERAALVVWLISSSPQGLTLSDVADLLGIPKRSVRALLETISRVTPITLAGTRWICVGIHSKDRHDI